MQKELQIVRIDIVEIVRDQGEDGQVPTTPPGLHHHEDRELVAQAQGCLDELFLKHVLDNFLEEHRLGTARLHEDRRFEARCRRKAW